MKVYKILFDILISCNIQIIAKIEEILKDNLSVKQLRFDKRYHLFLNLQHFYHEFTTKKNEDIEDKEIVLYLIDAIYTKYSAKYPFLESEQDLMLQTKRYITRCCECCFHFGLYSLLNADGAQYGLYPLSFVRDAEKVSLEIIESFKDENNYNIFNNEIIDFNKVRNILRCILRDNFLKYLSVRYLSHCILMK